MSISGVRDGESMRFQTLERTCRHCLTRSPSPSDSLTHPRPTRPRRWRLADRSFRSRAQRTGTCSGCLAAPCRVGRPGTARDNPRQRRGRVGAAGLGRGPIVGVVLLGRKVVVLVDGLVLAACGCALDRLLRAPVVDVRPLPLRRRVLLEIPRESVKSQA